MDYSHYKRQSLLYVNILVLRFVEPWRWKQHASAKLWYPHTKLQGVTIQLTTIVNNHRRGNVVTYFLCILCLTVRKWAQFGTSCPSGSANGHFRLRITVSHTVHPCVRDFSYGLYNQLLVVLRRPLW
jgi:hypothetical protein